MEFLVLCSALNSWVGALQGYKTHCASPPWTGLSQTELIYLFIYLFILLLKQLQH